MSRQSDPRQKKSDLLYSQNQVKSASYAMKNLISISVDDVMCCIALYRVLNPKNRMVSVMNPFAKTR